MNNIKHLSQIENNNSIHLIIITCSLMHNLLMEQSLQNCVIQNSHSSLKAQSRLKHMAVEKRV